jgi:hypothetical protein
MPIRKDLRHFYRTAAWCEARRRVLERAGGIFDLLGNYLGGAKCEACGKPDRTQVETFSDHAMGFLGHRGLPVMFWRTAGSGWHNWEGIEIPGLISFQRATRTIRVVLAVVHLNHTPGDDRDDNLRCLCQWCHLNYDKFEHRETRRTRKDCGRPLLAVGRTA